MRIIILSYLLITAIHAGYPSCDIIDNGEYSKLIRITGILPCHVHWQDCTHTFKHKIISTTWIYNDRCSILSTVEGSIQFDCYCTNNWSGFDPLHEVISITLNSPLSIPSPSSPLLNNSSTNNFPSIIFFTFIGSVIVGIFIFVLILICYS